MRGDGEDFGGLRDGRSELSCLAPHVITGSHRLEVPTLEVSSAGLGCRSWVMGCRV